VALSLLLVRAPLAATRHRQECTPEMRPAAAPQRMRGERMANDVSGGMGAGIGIGGILVIVGVLVAIFWSLWLGIIIGLVGLVAFGGFVRGRWY
jgi:hypothetical protein